VDAALSGTGPVLLIMQRIDYKARRSDICGHELLNLNDYEVAPQRNAAKPVCGIKYMRGSEIGHVFCF